MDEICANEKSERAVDQVARAALRVACERRASPPPLIASLPMLLLDSSRRRTFFPVMMDRWTSEAWEDAIRAVFRRALTDVPFRQLALRDPTEAFRQATGQTPPVSLRFVESLDEHVFVLPKLVQTDGAASEIDLSRILYHSFRQQSLPPTLTRPTC